MSTYRWIIFAVAAGLLGVGAWYFGRPIHPKPAPDEKRVASTTPAQVEAPKELPPKVIEVIDLTQAYEPVREPEPVALGPIDPASFIEEQSAPKRIPYAVDDDNPYRDLLIQIRETPMGSFWLGIPLVKPERIEIKPREVSSIQNGLLPEEPKPGEWVIAPMGNAVLIEPWFPQDVPVQNGLLSFIPIERLNVMPREVPFILGSGIITGR